MSNIQFIILLGAIFLAASFAASDESRSSGAAIVSGVLFGAAIYMELFK